MSRLSLVAVTHDIARADARRITLAEARAALAAAMESHPYPDVPDDFAWDYAVDAAFSAQQRYGISVLVARDQNNRVVIR